MPLKGLACSCPRLIAGLLLVLLELLELPSCQSASSPPNIILITIDTLRADRLSVYGNSTIRTPNIQRLADQGIVFEHAFTNVTWTVPSLATVMTGEYPFEHGVRTWEDHLDSRATLAALLHEHGYHTAAIVASAALDRVFGLNRGFTYYDDSLQPESKLSGGFGVSPKQHRLRRPHSPGREAYLHDDELADKAIAWLHGQRKEPFFLWVHFFGPHEKKDRDGSGPDGLQRAIAAYDPDVEFMDQQVGRFLDRLDHDPRAARTIVIFHSDHGQSLNEHGMIGHGLDLYDSTAHVPLIIRLPQKRRGGERVDRLVANIDLFRTILGLAAITAPPEVHGRDLLRSGPTDRAVYMETYLMTADPFVEEVDVGGRKLRVGRFVEGLRTRRRKLIVKGPALAADSAAVAVLPVAYVTAEKSVALFDLAKDPEEKHNVAKSHAGATEEMLTRLAGYTNGRAVGRHTALDEGTKERLRALGYLGK